MVCVTLTRIIVPRDFASLPTPGWEVALEGRCVAIYAEGRDGWLRQIGSSRLDALLGQHVPTWGLAKGYPSLDALRDAYVLCAKAWEERRVDALQEVPERRRRLSL